MKVILDEEGVPTFTAEQFFDQVPSNRQHMPRRTRIQYHNHAGALLCVNKKYRDVFNCHDCGVNTAHIGEYYMVKSDVWYSMDLTPPVLKRYRHPTNGRRFNVIDRNECMMCIGCLERRIGRTLTHRDFTNCPLNSENSRRSVRLQLRMMAIVSRPVRKNHVVST